MYKQKTPIPKGTKPFVYKLESKHKLSGTHTYLVSLDKKTFYKVRASSSAQAIDILNSIGQNPPSPHPAPPVPGRKSSTASASRSEITPINRAEVYQAIKQNHLNRTLSRGFKAKAQKPKQQTEIESKLKTSSQWNE